MGKKAIHTTTNEKNKDLKKKKEDTRPQGLIKRSEYGQKVNYKDLPSYIKNDIYLSKIFNGDNSQSRDEIQEVLYKQLSKYLPDVIAKRWSNHKLCMGMDPHSSLLCVEILKELCLSLGDEYYKLLDFGVIDKFSSGLKDALSNGKYEPKDAWDSIIGKVCDVKIDVDDGEDDDDFKIKLDININESLERLPIGVKLNEWIENPLHHILAAACYAMQYDILKKYQSPSYKRFLGEQLNKIEHHLHQFYNGCKDIPKELKARVDGVAKYLVGITQFNLAYVEIRYQATLSYTSPARIFEVAKRNMSGVDPRTLSATQLVTLNKHSRYFVQCISARATKDVREFLEPFLANELNNALRNIVQMRLEMFEDTSEYGGLIINTIVEQIIHLLDDILGEDAEPKIGATKKMFDAVEIQFLRYVGYFDFDVILDNLITGFNSNPLEGAFPFGCMLHQKLGQYWPEIEFKEEFQSKYKQFMVKSSQPEKKMIEKTHDHFKDKEGEILIKSLLLFNAYSLQHQLVNSFTLLLGAVNKQYVCDGNLIVKKVAELIHKYEKNIKYNLNDINAYIHLMKTFGALCNKEMDTALELLTKATDLIKIPLGEKDKKNFWAKQELLDFEILLKYLKKPKEEMDDRVIIDQTRKFMRLVSNLVPPMCQLCKFKTDEE